MYFLDKNENYFTHAPEVNKLTESFSARELDFYPAKESFHLYDSLSALHKLDTGNLFLAPGLEQVMSRVISASRIHLRLDTAILPDKSWDYYMKLAKQYFNFLERFSVREDKIGYFYDLEDLMKRLRGQKQCFVILPRPNNPTGNGIELKALTKLFNEFSQHTYFVDEAYAGFSDEEYAKSGLIDYIVESDLKNIIIGRSFSKFFGSPGIRLGYAVMGKKLAKKLEIEPYYLGMSSVTEQVALQHIKSYKFYLSRARRIKLIRETYSRKLLNVAPVKIFNSEASFIFGRVNEGCDINILESMLDRYDVKIKIFTDGVFSDCFRLTIAPEKIMDQVLAGFKEFGRLYN